MRKHAPELRAVRLAELPLVYGVPRDSVRAAIELGHLPAYRVSRGIQVAYIEDVEAWIEGRRSRRKHLVPPDGDELREVAAELEGGA